MGSLKSHTTMFIAVVVGAIFCLASCGKGSNDDSQGTGGGGKLPQIEFNVNTTKIVTSDFVGFGSQYNNNLYTTLSATVDGVSESNLPDLEAKVKSLASQHVRIFFDCKSWSDYPKYNAEFWPSFVKTVKLAQASGASVNITYWHGAYDDKYEESGQWPVSKQMNDFAEALRKLIIDEGLTCVKYITIQNEVNTISCTKENYVRAYRLLDTALKGKQIRDRVKFVGGDLLVDEIKDEESVNNWINYMAQNMNDIVDGYSVHIYWNYTMINEVISRIQFAYNAVEKLPVNQRKPIFVMEYSPTADWRNQSGAFAPGFVNGTTQHLAQSNVYALAHAWFQVIALNYKYVGFAKWDCYKAKYDNGTQYFSQIGIASSGYPIYPAYYMSWLFTHTCAPGWKVVSTNASTNLNKVVAVMQSANGTDMTIYMVNRTSGRLPYVLGGLPASKTFNVLAWNSDRLGRVKQLTSVTTGSDGTLTINLPEESFFAVTTLTVNNIPAN